MLLAVVLPLPGPGTDKAPALPPRPPRLHHSTCPSKHPLPPHASQNPRAFRNAAPEIDRQITPPPADVDIAPGKPGLGPLTFSPAAWESFALLQAPNAAVAREVYDVGSRDARAWARGAGLADASAAGRRGRREL